MTIKEASFIYDFSNGYLYFFDFIQIVILSHDQEKWHAFKLHQLHDNLLMRLKDWACRWSCK